MTIHASAHRQVGLVIKLIALRHAAMAFLARVARFQVCFMAERDVGRDLVYARPSDLPIVFRERRELLNRGTIGLNSGVALHANGRGSYVHHLTRIGIRMTHLAFQLQSSSVYLVAEWNRLLGRACGSLLCRLSGHNARAGCYRQDE